MYRFYNVPENLRHKSQHNRQSKWFTTTFGYLFLKKDSNMRMLDSDRGSISNFIIFLLLWSRITNVTGNRHFTLRIKVVTPNSSQCIKLNCVFFWQRVRNVGNGKVRCQKLGVGTHSKFDWFLTPVFVYMNAFEVVLYYMYKFLIWICLFCDVLSNSVIFILIFVWFENSFDRYSGEVGRFAQKLSQPNVGLYSHLRGISVVHGNLKDLSPKVSTYSTLKNSS